MRATRALVVALAALLAGAGGGLPEKPPPGLLGLFGGSSPDDRPSMDLDAYATRLQETVPRFEQGTVSHVADAAGWTALHLEADQGRASTVRALARAKADLEARDAIGQTPLHRAAARGHDAVAEILLKADAKPDEPDLFGRTPLMRAAWGGHAAVVRRLAAAGATSAGRTVQGETALHLAIHARSGEALDALAERRDPEAGQVRDWRGQTPLALAIGPRDPKLLERAIAAGANAAETRDGRPVMHALLFDLVRIRVDGFDVPEREIAAARAQAEVLLRNGCPADLAHAGTTALHIAASTGDAPAITLLLRHGAKSAIENPDGLPALHLAALEGSVEAVSALLDGGADPNFQTTATGETALHVAGNLDRWDVSKLLQRRGARTDLKDRNGKKPRLKPRQKRTSDSIYTTGGLGSDNPGAGPGAYGEGRDATRLLHWRSDDLVLPELDLLFTDLFARAAFVESERWLEEGRAIAVKDALGGFEGLADHNVGIADHNLGLVRARQRRYREAEALLRRAVSVFDPRFEAREYVRAGANFGALLADSGKFEEAAVALENALQSEAGDAERGVVLLELANVELALSRYAQARRRYAEVRGIRRSKIGLANVIANQGVLEHRLGDAAAARALYDEALALYRHASDGTEIVALGFGESVDAGAGAATALGNRGELARMQGDLAAAEKDLRDAIALAKSTGASAERAGAVARMNLGDVLLRRNKPAEASWELVVARTEVAAAFGPDQAVASEPIRLLAEGAIASRDLPRARKLVAEALAIADGGENPDWRWRVRTTWARLLRAQKNVPGAIAVAGEAVAQLRAEHADIASTLGGETAASFGRDADRAEACRLLADLLLEAGRLPEAAEAMRALKQEEQRDLVRGPAGEASPPAPEPWQERYEKIRGDVIALARELDARRQKPSGTPEEAIAIEASLEADLSAARKAFRLAVEEVLDAASKSTPVRAREIGEKNLETLRGLQSTLRELGPGAVALHYLVLQDRVRILVTTAEAQVARESRIDSTALNKRVFAFRIAVQNPKQDVRAEARALHGLLLAPIQKDLEQAAAKTLIVSLDGVLRYVPFAALHDGSGWAVERFAIATFTEGARDKLRDEPVREWRVAGLGVSGASARMSPLPGVKDELEAIVRENDADGGILRGTIRLDGAFTRRAFAEALGTRTPVVHIASHFVFTPGSSRSSYLVLGSNETLTLDAIQEEDFRFDGVDLLTLSACETAVGGGETAGREIEGFATLVQNLGARSVLATLWPVADRSTGALMKALYTERAAAGDPVPKAEALRRAQLSFIRGAGGSTGEARGGVPLASPGATALTSDTSRSYEHPYYWAPFVLLGNWR